MLRKTPLVRILSFALVLAFAIGLMPLASLPTQAQATAAPGDVVINEIMQNPSAVADSAGEWFELYNATGSAIDIDGWTILDNDFDTHVISNGGPLSIPAGGFLVLGNNTDSGTNGGAPVAYSYGSDMFLSNGSDEVVLLDGTLTEIDRVEYDNGATFPDPNGASMALRDVTLDNNIGANWCESPTSFGAGDRGTPGGANDCPTAPPPPPPTVTIMDIQSAGHISPFVGMEVTTSGIVTAIAFNGFYVQDPLGDADDATSDGMFVFTSSAPSVAVGDEVQLTDTIEEFIPGGTDTGNLSTTEMAFPNTTILSSGNPLPTPVIIGSSGRVPPAVDVISSDELPVNLQNVPGLFDPANDGIDFYESLEGMLVTIEDPVAVSATRTFNAFSSEMFVLTNNGANIAPANARTARGGINLQPDPANTGDQNPERVQIQFDATLYPFPVPAITVGDRLGDVTGVVGYSFGNFEVNALAPFSITPSGLPLETTSLLGTKDRVSVASYNVLNLSPLSEDDNQRATLASHIVNNLGSPDVIALQEIQDNNGDTDDGTTDASQTLQALVDAIVAAGGPTYAFFDVAPPDGTSGGVPGGNIRNAFLYNPDRVKLVEFVSLTPAVLADMGVSNPNAFDGTRDPLMATFKFRGKEFTVINNHLTSRFGSTPVFGGPQPFVQAGEAEREAQMTALNEVVDMLIAAGRGNDTHASKAGRVIVLGDLNTMEFTNDLTDILPGADGVLNNLIDTLTDDNVYTFNFEGNSQVLDHLLISDNLVPGASFDIVHVNVDFPRVDDTVGSDHEPLLVLLDLDAD